MYKISRKLIWTLTAEATPARKASTFSGSLARVMEELSRITLEDAEGTPPSESEPAQKKLDSRDDDTSVRIRLRTPEEMVADSAASGTSSRSVPELPPVYCDLLRQYLTEDYWTPHPDKISSAQRSRMWRTEHVLWELSPRLARSLRRSRQRFFERLSAAFGTGFAEGAVLERLDAQRAREARCLIGSERLASCP